jgi:hypothetical protein
MTDVTDLISCFLVFFHVILLTLSSFGLVNCCHCLPNITTVNPFIIADLINILAINAHRRCSRIGAGESFYQKITPMLRRL